jgi:hypothetical protein
VLEQVDDFSYFWSVVCASCPRLVIVGFICLLMVVFLCCVYRFNFCRRFCGKLFFLAIVCMDVHCFCSINGVNGRECIPVMWYLKQAVLCSIKYCTIVRYLTTYFNNCILYSNI